MIDYKDNSVISINELVNLYQSVSWTFYSDNLEKMNKILAGSLFYRSAWDDDQLIGLIRVIGDDASIIYIQDLLVSPSYHGRGIGKALLGYVLEKYDHIRQIVLLTDSDGESVQFYRHLGLVNAQDEQCIAFVKFNTTG